MQSLAVSFSTSISMLKDLDSCKYFTGSSSPKHFTNLSCNTSSKSFSKSALDKKTLYSFLISSILSLLSSYNFLLSITPFLFILLVGNLSFPINLLHLEKPITENPPLHALKSLSVFIIT